MFLIFNRIYTIGWTEIGPGTIFPLATTDDGIEFHDRGIAVTDEMWFINVFSFRLGFGFSMMDEVVTVSTFS